MTDWSYADAFARRMVDQPSLEPADDPLWPRIFGEPDAMQRVTRAWVRGHLHLLRRWRVDQRLGEIPTTFVHRGEAVAIEIGGVVVGTVSVDELLDG